MGFYQKQRDGVALRLITKYGTAMTLRVTTKGTYDANTRQHSADTVANHACVGVTVNYKNKDIDGTLIKRGDRQILLSASGLSVEPTTLHQILVGTKKYQIVDCEPLAPGEVPVIYTLQVRN